MKKNVLKVSVASLFFMGVGVYGQKKDTAATERKIDEVIVVGYMAAFFRQVKIGVLTLTLEKKQ